MADVAHRPTPKRAELTQGALLVAVLVAALVIRLALLRVPGHAGDVQVMARWAENLAAYGPWDFYVHDSSIYPTLLPFLWPLGLGLDGEALGTVLKGLSIPFDLVIGLVLYAVVARRTRRPTGLLAASLYLFNPGVLLAGPVWGQVDAVGTLVMLGSILALATHRFAAAGGLAALAGLAKPQFGLIALPVLAVVALRARRVRRARPLIAAGIGALVAILVVGAFTRLGPGTWIASVLNVVALKPWTSANALNPWGLLVGFRVDDAPYVGIGTLLLVLGLVSALLPLRRGSDLPTLLTVGLLIAFAFYFLPTRVHERYLFPALALAAPLAAVDRRCLVAYLVMSAAFALSLLRALADTTPIRLPPGLETALLSGSAVWLIGLALMGGAGALAWLSLSGAGRALAPTSANPG